MNFLINQNNEFTQSYTKEEVQNLLDEKKIGVNTEIWTEQWGEWKQIKDTEFNFQNAIYIRSKKKPINLKILFGALLLIGGIIVTVISICNPEKGGIIAYGAIIYGAIKIIKGLDEVKRGDEVEFNNMFKNSFSFNGRIRRTEYSFSVLIYLVTTAFFMFIVGNDGNIIGILILSIIRIPLFWFILAQGAKRCHDIGNNGLWQLIPFYALWLIFQNGQAGSNKFGDNPKDN